MERYLQRSQIYIISYIIKSIMHNVDEPRPCHLLYYLHVLLTSNFFSCVPSSYPITAPPGADFIGVYKGPNSLHIHK